MSKQKSGTGRRRSGRPRNRIIGLNSGTSADGLDIVFVEFDERHGIRVLDSGMYRYENAVRRRIISCSEPGFENGNKWLELDVELGRLFARMTDKFIRTRIGARNRINLIGSHGQTVRHIPRKKISCQLGDPAIIASETGIPVVAGFRRSDIAAGGEGAPLSPLLHEELFRDRRACRAIVNIGGIANITILPPVNSARRPFASDCGPGNMAIDGAMAKLYGRSFDKNGAAALSGRPDNGIVSRAIRKRFFDLPPPKSTGRELFGGEFLRNVMDSMSGRAAGDIVATLSELTVAGIAGFIRRYAGQVTDIFLCGGGAKNLYIVSRLKAEFPRCAVGTTAELGYDPDYIEAILWAYLALCHATSKPVDASRFTGASKPYIPGALWLP